MKKIFKNVLMFGGLMTMMAACSNDVDAPMQKGNTPLQVKVMADSPNSRAIVHGEVFPANTQIGLTLVDESGTKYDGNTYSNLLYETADGAAWTLDANAEQPMLSSTAGKVVAYYPWAENANYTALDVETGSQTDYMYSGDWVTGISNSAPQVNLEMKHALAAFRIFFSKDAAYVADATVTNVKITSDAFVAAAKLNALTGALTGNTASAAVETSIAANHVLDTDGKPADDSDAGQFSELIVVQADAKATTLTFTVTVKDANDVEKEYSAVVTPYASALAAGSIYEYSLKLSAKGFEVGSVNVVEWEPVENAGSGELKPAFSWKNMENGVYAVSADGSAVSVASATDACVAVALVAGEHRFMIEKNEASNTLYWEQNKSYMELTKYTTVDGTHSVGYFGGAPIPQMPTDYTKWTAGALSDFNGKANTAVIAANSTNPRDMCKALNTFNASNNKGDWYIPACGQLTLIYLNVTEINQALEKIGGQLFTDDYYWSSTEFDRDYAWFVKFNGYLEKRGKSFTHSVRYIRDLK